MGQGYIATEIHPTQEQSDTRSSDVYSKALEP